MAHHDASKQVDIESIFASRILRLLGELSTPQQQVVPFSTIVASCQAYHLTHYPIECLFVTIGALLRSDYIKEEQIPANDKEGPQWGFRLA